MHKQLLILVLVLMAMNTNVWATHKPVKNEKLLAMIDSSDSGTSMTLEKANKNAEAAKNNRSRFFPIFFAPLLIVIIVIAAKRKKKRQEEEKKK